MDQQLFLERTFAIWLSLLVQKIIQPSDLPNYDTPYMFTLLIESPRFCSQPVLSTQDIKATTLTQFTLCQNLSTVCYMPPGAALIVNAWRSKMY